MNSKKNLSIIPKTIPWPPVLLAPVPRKKVWQQEELIEWWWYYTCHIYPDYYQFLVDCVIKLDRDLPLYFADNLPPFIKDIIEDVLKGKYKQEGGQQ